MSRLVTMHPKVLAAFPGQLPVKAVVDSVWEAANGQKLIVRAARDGTGYVEFWPPDGRRSIASDPSATRGTR